MNKLKEIRKKRGYSQARLAFDSGVAQGIISNLEKGKQKNARYETVYNLAEVLNVKESDLKIKIQGGYPKSKITKLRAETGYSQKDLANLAGITITTLKKLESGKTKDAKHEELISLAELLGCTVEDLGIRINDLKEDKPLIRVPKVISHVPKMYKYLSEEL